MIPIAVIAIDSVLLDEATSTTIPTGRYLYDALAHAYRIFLVEDVVLNPLWLTINGFESHQRFVNRIPDDPEDKVARRLRQLERIRGMGGTVQLLIDPDPLVAAAASKLGITCLHYVDAPYARPEFHPDYKFEMTPWEKMVEEIDRSKVIRAADTRMIEDE